MFSRLHQDLVSDEQMTSSDGRKQAKKALSALFKEKFMTLPTDKTGKASKDLKFMKAKLRF